MLESDFCHLESIRSSGVCIPRFFGIIFFICTHFGDNGNDFWAHRTNSELQLLRCSFLKLQVFNDSACQRSSDSGPMCLEDLVGYPWWDSAFGVGGSGRSPIECALLEAGFCGALQHQ